MSTELSPERGDSHAGERPLYNGRGHVRPAVGLDAGSFGTWTIRGGWVTGSGQRPAHDCADSFALWCQGSRLFVAVAAARVDASPAAVMDAGLGISQLIDVAHAMPRDPAHILLSEQQKVLQARSGGRPGAAEMSFVIGVFPERVPAHGRAVATLAACGPRAGAWILGDNGAQADLLAPSEPGLRALDRLEVLDGDVICIATSALALPAASGRFRPLWDQTPDEPAFLRFLLQAAHGQRDGAALVAMWSGHYQVTLP